MRTMNWNRNVAVIGALAVCVFAAGALSPATAQSTAVQKEPMSQGSDKDEPVEEPAPEMRSSGDAEKDVRKVGPEEARKQDLELIAETMGWSLEDTDRHMKVQDRFGDIVAEIAEKFPQSFAGSSLVDKPGGASIIRFKGRVPDSVKERVADAGISIEVVGGSDFSAAELRDRSIAIVKHLAAAGFEEAGTAVLEDGVIDVTIRVRGAKKMMRDEEMAQGEEEVVARRKQAARNTRLLPPELRRGARVTVVDHAIIMNEHSRGGARVRNTNTGGACTSGFAVTNLTTAINGITTAAHCTGINDYTQHTGGANYALSHRGQHLGLFGDVEWKSSSHIEPPEFFADQFNNIRDVTSVEACGSISNNNTYCVYGRSSNDRECDQVYSTFVTGMSGLTIVSFLVAMDDDNTVAGDSGGGWSFSNEAAGGHRGDQWIWFGTRNVWSVADLFPVALGVAVQIQ